MKRTGRLVIFTVVSILLYSVVGCVSLDRLSDHPNYGDLSEYNEGTDGVEDIEAYYNGHLPADDQYRRIAIGRVYHPFATDILSLALLAKEQAVKTNEQEIFIKEIIGTERDARVIEGIIIEEILANELIVTYINCGGMGCPHLRGTPLTP